MWRCAWVLADSAMTARRIGKSRLLVLGTPSYFAKAGEPSRPAELLDHPVVIYAQGGVGSTWTFRNGTVEETMTLKDRVRVTAAEGVREAVFAGLGLCVATEWMFQPELDHGRVKQVMPDWELPSLSLWAAFPTGPRASAKARAFASFVEDQLRQTTFAPQLDRVAPGR